MTTSTAATQLPSSAADRRLITTSGWTWIAVLAGLFLYVHWSYVNRMIHIATKASGGLNPLELIIHMIKNPWNPDWSHTLVVPLISLYFISRNRDRMAATRPAVFLPGLIVFVFGLLSFNFWTYPGRNDMFQGYSMIITLFGLALFLLGPSMMRHLWFPILYLALFVKISDRIWDSLAWRLQGIAAQCATVLLHIFSLFLDFDVNKVGNKITIGFMQDGAYLERGLEVAQACSGLRMLMAFIALGVAMAYLTDRGWWQRLIMILMAVPIAVAVNVGRVTMLGLLNLVNEEMTKGDFHTFLGMLMLIPAAGLFWLLGWVLDRIVVTDPTQAQTVPPPLPPEETGAPPIDARLALDVVKGAAGGVLLSVLIGVNCYLIVMSFRPDIGLQLLQKIGLIAEDAGASMSSLTPRLLLGVGVIALIGAIVGYCWMLLRHRGAAQDGRRGLIPLGSRGGTMAMASTAGILLASIFGFGTVRDAYGLVLMKEPVKLQKKLYQLRRDFWPWAFAASDKDLGPEELEVLGTRDYISYHMRDQEMMDGDRPVGVRWHMAYYTGKPDTVPHVPDRCYIGGGASGAGKSTVTLNLEGKEYRRVEGQVTAYSVLDRHRVSIPDTTISATIFRYHDPNTPDRIHRVLYFFVANNKFLANPDLVRAQGFLPWDRFSYYCKVEIGLGLVDSDEVAAARASRFLSTMMPEIMACLPDWQAVNATVPTDGPSSAE